MCYLDIASLRKIIYSISCNHCDKRNILKDTNTKNTRISKDRRNMGPMDLQSHLGNWHDKLQSFLFSIRFIDEVWKFCPLIHVFKKSNDISHMSSIMGSRVSNLVNFQKLRNFAPPSFKWYSIESVTMRHGPRFQILNPFIQMT